MRKVNIEVDQCEQVCMNGDNGGQLQEWKRDERGCERVLLFMIWWYVLV
jgi:hypothetical protein